MWPVSLLPSQSHTPHSGPSGLGRPSGVGGRAPASLPAEPLVLHIPCIWLRWGLLGDSGRPVFPPFTVT